MYLANMEINIAQRMLENQRQDFCDKDLGRESPSEVGGARVSVSGYAAHARSRDRSQRRNRAWHITRNKLGKAESALESATGRAVTMAADGGGAAQPLELTGRNQTVSETHGSLI